MPGSTQNTLPKWRSIGAIALTVALIVLWLIGKGPDAGGCCNPPRPVPVPMPAPQLTPASQLMPSSLNAVATIPLCPRKTTLSLNFAPGSALLDASSADALKAAAQCIGGPTEIGSHTDNQGNESRNRALSQARADAVKAALAANGVKPELLTAKGHGSTMPVADNASLEGRAKNQRIELSR